MASMHAGGETSVWRKLLAPMEGILGGAPQETNPFSPEAIRKLAEKERAAKAKADELPPGAPLRDVSVANPLRYLKEIGIARSRQNSGQGMKARRLLCGARFAFFFIV
jgi:hypothetical protein